MGERSVLNSDQFTQGCVLLNLQTSQDNLPRQPVSIFTFSHSEDFLYFLMASQNFSWFSFLSYSCLDPSVLEPPVDPRKSPLTSRKPLSPD